MTLDHARILSKAHRQTILRALADSPKGLTYSHLAFDVVKTSGTNLALKELRAAGFVERDGTSRVYRITANGRKALEHLDALVALEAS